MANCYSPIVFEQGIPAGALTPLEEEIFAQLFDQHQEGDLTFYYSSEGRADTLIFTRKELRLLLEESDAIDSQSPASDFARGLLEDDAWSGCEDIEMDEAGEANWEGILSRVIARGGVGDAAYLNVSRFDTGDRMGPGEWGATVILITADSVAYKTTDMVLTEMIRAAGLEPAPG